MKRKLAIPALLLVLALIPVTQALALDWGLGAELGGSIFRPDYPDAEGIATLSWPTIGPAFAQIGGLRVSFIGSKPTHEIWAGTAYSSLTTGGRSTNRFMTSLNYQYNFATEGRVDPYATAGAGVINASGNGYSASGAVFGAGVGLSRSVSDAAGRLRGELRYDQQTEGRSKGSAVVPKGGTFGLKLGFDLWVK